MSTEQTKTVVHAYVTSKLDQNNSLLSGVPSTKIAKLQRVQNAAAKLIVGAKKRDHVTMILKQLHWLPVEFRIDFKVLLLTYKALHGEGPVYLQSLFEWHRPSRALRSASQLLLSVPVSNLATYGDRAFCVYAPVRWNSLPHKVRSASSTNAF